ncbi:Ada metal-binding domain-containing protein [Streptomyces sp. NPDC046985]|uniref:Ada metal-binding domain-containing protein n=1 Tax=Streptomyces sp. NPDC046985 TaxID=3155377 RepID=UPI003410E841
MVTAQHNGHGHVPHAFEAALASLPAPAPEDFALSILRHVGVPESRYDIWVSLETAAGPLWVAHSRTAVTGALLEGAAGGAEEFEAGHWRRTRRTVVRGLTPLRGVRTALRTGRARRLPVDLTGLSPTEQAVLTAVREIPNGQMRPLSWVVREASATDAGTALAAIRHNPVQVLVPSHRVTYDDGTPCDLGLPEGSGSVLRTAEGMDLARLDELTARGAFFLGSDTTRIYCHPTCAHARRITPPHRHPFRTAQEAHRAGYRACRVCRPLTV